MAGTGASAAGTAGKQCARQPPPQPRHNSWKAAERKLAPLDPSHVVLCRYTDHLIRRAVPPAPAVGQLVRDYDSLGPPPKKPEFTSCFFAPDPVVAYLKYDDDHVVTIYTPTSSCIFPTNGDLRRVGNPRQRARLRRELLALTRATQRRR